ncbi:MAG: copper chaperone PCu(A)C [Georgfuchsia sp.]
MIYGRFLLFAALFASIPAYAADVGINSAWVRSTVPAQTTSTAYMALTSKGRATLVGISTPVAEDAEVHEMQLEGGVMKMRTTQRLPLPAGETVTLKPGGYHIMLIGLKQQLKPGDMVPITLRIENANMKVDTLVVNADVHDMTESPASSGHDHMHMHLDNE